MLATLSSQHDRFGRKGKLLVEMMNRFSWKDARCDDHVLSEARLMFSRRWLQGERGAARRDLADLPLAPANIAAHQTP